MLTKIRVRNFKGLEDVEVELGKSVVLVGPNNSGKTATLQALALWETGLRRWREVRGDRKAPGKRPGVTINRLDLISVPVPQSRLLWHDLHVRAAERGPGGERTGTANVVIEVTVEGIANDGSGQWEFGLEFDYANPESFYCRPVRSGETNNLEPLAVPIGANEVRVAFLPPMSGLAAVEERREAGRIDVLIGEGQTAQVLRNLCYQVREGSPTQWRRIVSEVESLFGVTLLPPQLDKDRGEITMSYREHDGPALDLSCAGRGLQQTLLLLAYLHQHPGAVLLLDEPDAHLEVFRQREIYNLLVETAEEHGGQIIVATHSEVVLNEAAGRDIVVAFVGRPHRLNDRFSQLRKALTEIGWDQYYQAAQAGWILYLEGSTDLAMLKALAERLKHPATEYLDRPFVKYVGNQPKKAQDHFFGLKEAKRDLVAIAIYDRLETEVESAGGITQLTWQRNELENYLCREDVLVAYARGTGDDLFAQERERAMREAVSKVSNALRVLGEDPWSAEVKASDRFLDPVFENYYEALGLPNQMRKTDYHILAHLVPPEGIDPEIVEKLDAIVAVAEQANPA